MSVNMNEFINVTDKDKNVSNQFKITREIDQRNLRMGNIKFNC